MQINDDKSFNKDSGKFVPFWQMKDTAASSNSFKPIFNFSSDSLKTDFTPLDNSKGGIFENYKNKVEVQKDIVNNSQYICEPVSTRVDILEPLDMPKDTREIKLIHGDVKVVPHLKTNYNKNSNVTRDLFDGNVEDLNKLLKNTPMKGQGKAFLDAQEKYGINAIFLMSVVKAESTYGTAPAKGTKYNVSGMKTRSGKYQQHKSYEESIEKLASNLSRLYIHKSGKKLVTIEQIRSQYCPGNKKWTPEVTEEMNRLSKSIAEMYN